MIFFVVTDGFIELECILYNYLPMFVRSGRCVREGKEERVEGEKRGNQEMGEGI